MTREEALSMLARLEHDRTQLQHGSTDWCFRMCEAAVAEAAGFGTRQDWEELLK